MTRYKDWFSVDVKKRAARIRTYTLGHVLKELVANSLDAKATRIALTLEEAEGTRKDRNGLRAFEVRASDNGQGCPDPEILRRIGSSTSDLDAETRGRFGQGLIDVLAICDRAEIRTLGFRLGFDKEGCAVTRSRIIVPGMEVQGVLRHTGDGLDDLQDYFNSPILPADVELLFNGLSLDHRKITKIVPGLKLQTVIYDPAKERVRKQKRETSVQILDQFGGDPRIFELGIPVDIAGWDLPFDINVLQKTPLDTERNVLPDNYKHSLVSQLIGPLSEEYAAYLQNHGNAPREILDDRENAPLLSQKAQCALAKIVTGAEPDRIVRRNPLDPDDLSESQELENLGYVPLNRGSLSAGVSEILRDALTVSEVHDRDCKVHFEHDPDFPEETKRQTRCMEVFQAIAEALLGTRIRIRLFRGKKVTGAWGNGTISLNIDFMFLWDDPLGEKSLGVVLHECAHSEVSGHSVPFEQALARLGGRLAGWVAHNASQWNEFEGLLYGRRKQSLEPADIAIQALQAA